MPRVEEASFDTNLFGLSVGRIELDESEPSSISGGVVLEGMLRQAYGAGMKLVYLFAPPVDRKKDPTTTVDPETVLPGIKVDDKTTYAMSLSGVDRSILPSKAFFGNKIAVSSLAKSIEPPTPEVRELAISSGEWSRFRIDTNIPQGVYEAMFEAWIVNSINRSIADEVFVAKDIETQDTVGIITLKLKGKYASIGLLAVSRAHRRRGIASMLLNRAALWCLEQTSWADDVGLSVVTQGANKVACSCYERFGFRVDTTQSVYHVWLPQHLEEPKLRADQAPIPFCKQFFTGKEVDYVSQVFATGLDSAARFTTMCAARLKEILGPDSERVVMVPSGTAALEMAALLCGLQAGDEVIMPSYTFASTANAFVLRGAVPVFVDCRRDTLNMDETLIEAAITERTKAICCVHYGGVPCEMDTICEIAARRNVFVIEDAAQGFLSTYKGRAIGTLGHFGCFSFHYTKNVICGEGGAISINRSAEHARSALILWEKGTNRYDFMAGKIDKYEWIDVGSSYVPSEVSSAILWGQLEHSHEITTARLANFSTYAAALKPLHDKGSLRIPVVPDGCVTNAHIFFIILPSQQCRSHVETELKKKGISAFSHYVPLHSAPAGRKFGRVGSVMTETDAVHAGLLRLPIWVGLKGEDLAFITEAVIDACSTFSS